MRKHLKNGNDEKWAGSTIDYWVSIFSSEVFFSQQISESQNYFPLTLVGLYLFGLFHRFKRKKNMPFHILLFFSWESRGQFSDFRA